MTQRPGGAPFMDRLPQSVVDRFEGTQKTAAVDEPYLHASNVLFEPGDTVHPASALGLSSIYEKAETKHYSPDHVYLYKASEVPEQFRLQGGAVYEVEPHGEIEPDPESWRGQQDTPGSYRTKGLVTVKRLVQNNWRDPKENIPEGLRGDNWAPSEQPRAKKTAKTAASETCFGSNHHKPISESQIVGSGQSYPAHCGFCGRDFDVKVRWDSDGYPFVAIPRHNTPVKKTD